jgi:hypothetical protein
MSEATVEAALAAPGAKLAAWDASRPGEAGWAIFSVSAAGARCLAQVELTGDREATAAAWRRRGLRAGAWYCGHTFVWVADQRGCVVWSRESIVLELTRSSLQLAGSRVRPHEVQAVVSFVADDWIHRGVRLELNTGADDVIVLDEYDEIARLDPTYNYDNWLMSDGAWVSCFGRDLAAWLGAPHRDDAFGR